MKKLPDSIQFVPNFINRLRFSWLYLRRPRWDSGLTPPELLEFLKTCSPGRAIDLGCGTGTNVLTLAGQGWQVTGVDFASAAIRQARKKARQANLSPSFIIGDVSHLGDSLGSFDLALDIGCFHSLGVTQKRDYFHQLENLLAPSGTWFLYTFLAETTTPGLSTFDLDMILSRYRLVSRQDGFDRGQRHSAYFVFQKN